MPIEQNDSPAVAEIRRRYAEFDSLPTGDALNHYYASHWTIIRDLLAEIDRLKASH